MLVPPKFLHFPSLLRGPRKTGKTGRPATPTQTQGRKPKPQTPTEIKENDECKGSSGVRQGLKIGRSRQLGKEIVARFSYDMMKQTYS